MAAIFQLFRDHWFKLALIVLASLFFWKKEISFQVNMRNREALPKEKPSQGRYTENKVMAAAKEETLFSIFNLFELLPSGKNLKEEFDAIPTAQKVSFVKRFGKVARDEQAKFGIPASVILAEAMLQSSVGTRVMAQESNNYFALPCGKYWKGETVNEGAECYRQYPSAWESFRDHSQFMTKSLEAPKDNDYKNWIAAIAENFNTKEEYTQLLLSIIEEYKLFLLDK